MTVRYSEKVRNARLDATVAAIGPAPTLKIYGDAKKVLAAIALPRDWMTKASDGMVRKKGAWSARAEADGEATSFAFEAADGSHIDGLIPHDMELDNANLKKGQVVTVEHYVIASGNG